MERTCLTSENRAWLEMLAQANRIKVDFILYNLTSQSNADVQRHAGAVPIWHEGAFVLASEVLDLIKAKLPSSQIYEQWQSYLYQDVIRTCSRLSPFDSRVFLMASGFHQNSEEEIYSSAGEAVSDAYEALYGSWEDHNNDEEPY